MATIGAGIITMTTTAGDKTAVATPLLNDIVLIFSVATGVTPAAPTDNNPDGLGTYTQVDSTRTGFSTSGNLNAWIRNSLSGSNTSTTYSSTQTSSTGGGIYVFRISGITRTGSNAIRQSAGVNSGTAATTPTGTMGVAVLTTNPVVGVVCNGATTATITQRGSPAYTEDIDTGYNTPATGIEGMRINSGETASSIAWGSTSASAYALIVVELDASAVAAADDFAPYMGGGYYP